MDMAVGSPKASSTPKRILTVKSRPSIKDNESVQSPISAEQCLDQSESDQESNEETEEVTQELFFKEPFPKEPFPKEPFPEEPFSKPRQNLHWYILSTTIIGVIAILTFSYSETKPTTSSQSISTTLLNQFPSQGIDFWLNIEVAIKDITAYEQPKCIIFLHENDNTEITEKILSSILDIAFNELSPTLASSLILTPSELNTEDNLKDYGKILTKNKDLLEQHRVMIVKNLEKINGISAQAFHSFCDEFTPVIKKALLLFTVNVPELPTQPNKYLRGYLRQQWKNLHEEKFAPLFTRISSSVLLVTKEE